MIAYKIMTGLSADKEAMQDLVKQIQEVTKEYYPYIELLPSGLYTVVVAITTHKSKANKAKDFIENIIKTKAAVKIYDVL